MDTVTIKKVDEVYIKLIAEPGIIMELTEDFKFDVPGAQFSPKFKNRVWDGKIRLLNPMTGRLYAGLRHRVEEICKEKGFQVEYASDFSSAEFSVKEAEDFVKKIAPAMEPRDYQMDAFIKGVRERRSLLLSPTGSGKSFIIYLLTRYYAKRTLIIVPTVNLVNQLSSDFADYGFNSDRFIHRVSGGVDKQSDKPITISTWQSIYELPQVYFDSFDVVIGDECHLFAAKSLKGIMENCVNAEHKFGFTGTLDGSKTNKLVLEGLFGPVYKVATTSDLIDQGYLSKIKIKAIVLSYSDEIKKLVTLPERNRFISNLALSLKGNTLVLFRYTDQGKKIYEKIAYENPDRNVFFIDGSITGSNRETIRHSIEDEENAIIVASSGTTSTGVNIKRLHNIIFASPSKSRIKNLQSIGRVLRTSEDKSHATLFDISDDLTWKTRRNHTLLHFMERISTYNEEKFPYKLYNVSLTVKK